MTAVPSFKEAVGEVVGQGQRGEQRGPARPDAEEGQEDAGGRDIVQREVEDAEPTGQQPPQPLPARRGACQARRAVVSCQRCQQ